MTPKTRLRPSDRSARTPPSSTPLSSASSKKMSKTASGFISHAQVGFADRVGRQQFGGAAGGADAAGLQQVGTVDDAEDLLHVLLDDEHGEAAGADALDEVEHLLDEDRREPGRRLVEQQQPGRRHEGAADGAHLLLAAGHAAGELAMALPKTRKQLVDDVELLAEFRAAGAKPPILRLSSTVMRGNRRRLSGTWAMPSSTIRCAGVAARSTPSMTSVPEVGRIRPETTRINVVLPAPFGPMTPTPPPRGCRDKPR